MNKSYSSTYNPDVLSTLANLSSDEVFTPPHIVNQMLDMLPQELFSDKTTTFLDPATKSGVFLREITKRLINGLEKEIPDLQDRLDHILHNQVFGIAITELTALLSRRSLYCSKYPNSKYSISKFLSIFANIYFEDLNHTFIDGRCSHCGASERLYSSKLNQEKHAYSFIHNERLSYLNNMKFDVIIGNPPYQLDDGGAKASAAPIYHLFVRNAIKLNPRYISMIVPSRWFSGGKNLSSFRNEMLNKNNLRIIRDFPNASECFPGVEIKGGVNYFLWERDFLGNCLFETISDGNVVSSMNRPLLEKGLDVLIRNNDLVSIYKKVSSKSYSSFKSKVSAAKAYGLRNDFFKDPSKYNLPAISESKIENGYTIYGLDESQNRTTRYISKDYPLPKKTSLMKYKFFVTESYGIGSFGEVPSKPISAGPGELCTETFLQIGPFDNEQERDNCMAYWTTKFFRTMVGVKKITQHCTQECYSSVPLVPLDRFWTDEELYEEFSLNEKEIDFIETNVKAIL
jgi:site-specific DNA-methyltransferase (adenine-specific)